MHKVQFTSNPINLQLFSKYIYRVLALLTIMSLLLISHKGLAADPNPFESSPTSELASCPANHKMYYLGSNPPTSTSAQSVVALPLSWTAGNTSKIFTFADNKIFTIAFPILIDANNSDGTVPFYGSNNGVTSDAINLVHNSTRVQTDHSLDLSVNRPVSKIGYKIQDLDSTMVNTIIGYGSFFGIRYPIYGDRTPYIEQVDVSATNGQLTFNNIFHNINAQRNIVTAKEGENCNAGQCTIDAAWGYKPANSVVTLLHNNAKSETSGSHATGYSDFYFCLAPPKIIVKKALNGVRINDTNTNKDQFELSINRGTNVVNAVTTTGSGSAVTNNDNRNAVSIAENTSYTITERVMNGTIIGDIANYDATYTCNNATTGSTTVMPTTAMTYNSTDKTRSFTLSNATYGDEITCTITNTPKAYTFSGTVFNDNGGITSPDPQLIGSPYNNPNFFNGIFDTNEAGIDGMNIVKVRLSDCSNNPSANPIIATVNTTSLGKYSFSVTAKDLAGKTDLCIEELEPNNWLYSVDTTSNIRKFSFVPSVLTYQTGVKINSNTLNLDFGNVIKENTALVLKKAQYINNCPSTLNYTDPAINTSNNNDPRIGFSTESIDNIDPGKCIAYRITATNRANINIDNFVMKDVLQQKGVSNAIVTSVLTNPSSASADYASDSVAIGQNGTVKTKTFTLAPKTKRDFYFNTKYGSTVNAQ
ncbi:MULTISPECIES: hypothetical protein [unclassified Psychrobacter]|uniref:hypothetical protein n=3 Tax=Gammaproteobacteria TaxID=1236 RepID=UPI00047092F0|nr:MULTISPECIES: hypothetical protein [unclassified Psychrobacter]|tara:strand:- start:12107 stop:14215 length:2109 start_codon:yes stop_codon:yes gene_type:complete